MFTRPRPPLPDPATSISVASPVRARRVPWLRLLKRGIACLFLAVAVMALAGNAASVTSDDAVVTTHVVSLRSPIEGVVRSRIGSVGAPVASGVLLAQVVNGLADDRPVAELRLQGQRLAADLAALRTQRTGLAAMLDGLGQRVARHRDAKLQQLGFDARRASRDREARAEALAQLVRDMNRKQALRGIVPDAEVEQAVTAVQVAAQELAGSDTQRAAAEAAEAAEQTGVLVEANSGNDVTYSEQRADEVRLRLAELDRAIAAAEAEATETAGRLAVERQAYDQRHEADLRTPSAGMIWRLGAGPGERVAPGDLLAQTVDCATAYLAVDVPQNRVTDIDLSAPVRFRLSGEQQDRDGTITAITGAAALHGDGATAMAPSAGTRPVASVIVAVPPSANQVGSCLVGRTARVRMRTIHLGWFETMRRWLPF
jgi:multidrug resistance efflux pump